MTTKATIIIVVILIIVSIFSGVAVWDKLPDQMASHWDANDQVNGYMAKTWGVLMVPMITAGMLLLFLLVPSMDPLKANIAEFRETFNLFIVFTTTFLLYIHGLSLAWNLGYQNFKMSAAMLPLMGLLFIFIGYMLKKAKRNFFIGIRTPWTLSSDKVWDKTHQLGSVLFTFSGVLAVIGGFIGGITAFWLMFIPLLGSTIILVIYSYILYLQEQRSRQ